MERMDTHRAVLLLAGFILAFGGAGAQLSNFDYSNLVATLLFTFGGMTVGYVSGAEDADRGEI